MKNLNVKKIYMYIVYIVFWFTIIITISTVIFAQGLKISPGAFCMQNAEIGKDLDLGIDLIITNDSADEKTYIIRPILPSQARTSW